MRNIAFVGPMHSGKTTAANYLVEHYGYQRIALADGVKQLASDMLTEATYYLTGKVDHPTVADINKDKAIFRPFLQWLGTDFVREYLGMPTYWIDSFLLQAQESRKPVVCDDVRFVNEAEALKRAGFEIVCLHRSEPERQESVMRNGGSIATLTHASETQTNDIDSTEEWFTNDIAALYRHIDTYMDTENIHNGKATFTHPRLCIGPAIELADGSITCTGNVA